MPKKQASRDKLPAIFESDKAKVTRPASGDLEDRSSPAPTPLATLPPETAQASLISAGDLRVAEDTVVRESIWAHGKLVVGARAAVESAVTAKGGAEVGEGARIDGLLSVTGRLRWGRGATAASANLEGPFVTSDGGVRATSLVAPGGIHAGSATTVAVSR